MNRWVIVVAALLAVSSAQARTIYQCKTPTGATTMQDVPCDIGASQTEQDVQDAYQGTKQKTKRSAKAKAAFQREVPCPRNGARRGRCPGYDIDHVKPLCAGGPDTPENMQWLTLEAHRDKTRDDVKLCRFQRRVGA